MLFAALAQEIYYSRMLAPYIDHEPSPQQLADEEHRMSRSAKEYEQYMNMDWFRWDGEPLEPS